MYRNGFDGFTYGPLGTFLSELFPTNIRYSGTSLAFNMAGIIGAAFAPMIAIWLATHYSLTYVGLTFAACISLFSLLVISKGNSFSDKQWTIASN
jgi:MFS family permease